jgi:flagellar biosynthesis/type III secretory pathway protein FliH
MDSQLSRIALLPTVLLALIIEELEMEGLQLEITVRVTQNNSNIINTRLTNTKEISQM